MTFSMMQITLEASLLNKKLNNLPFLPMSLFLDLLFLWARLLIVGWEFYKFQCCRG
jgi:hypothetical protein